MMTKTIFRVEYRGIPGRLEPALNFGISFSLISFRNLNLLL